MLIKDLIEQLQKIYDIEKTWEGGREPEIMIDVFESNPYTPGEYVYKGFSKEFSIQKSDDGIYNILSRFK